MKRLLVLILMTLFFAGCGAAARESGFWQHDAQYRDLDHLKFSWWGYKNPTATDAKEAQQQKWWGIEVPYIPAK
jgi:hypothetical protein